MEAVTAFLDIAKHFSVISSISTIKIISAKEIATAMTTDGKISAGAFFAERARGSGALTSTPTVICYCELNEPIEDFVGTIGLNHLDVLIGFDAFEKDAKKKLVHHFQDNKITHTEIIFEYSTSSKSGYALTSEKAINAILQVPPFQRQAYELTLRPTEVNIKAFNHFSRANAKTGFFKFWPSMNARGKLYFSFDERKPSDSTERFEFGKQLPFVKLAPILYPANHVAEVLTLAGTSKSLTMHFSNKGVMQIDVVSELGNYHFIFLGDNRLIWAWNIGDDWPQVYGIEQMILEDRTMHHDWAPNLD